MVVVSSTYQLLRWALAVATALISAMIFRYAQLSQYHDSVIMWPAWLAMDCLVGLLALEILPLALSFYLDTPCLCDHCAESDIRHSDERIPQHYIYAVIAMSLFSLRRVAEGIYVYGSRGPQPADHRIIIAIHTALAHKVMRRLDKLRSRHFDNKPGSWSKDRMFPVQPPLNSISNAVMTLMNLLLASPIILAISLTTSILSQNQHHGWFWPLFEPKASGIVLYMVFSLQREFWYLTNVLARSLYDRVEERSEAEWRKTDENAALCTWIGHVIFN